MNILEELEHMQNRINRYNIKIERALLHGQLQTAESTKAMMEHQKERYSRLSNDRMVPILADLESL